VIESLYEMGHAVFAININESALNENRDIIVSGSITFLLCFWAD